MNPVQYSAANQAIVDTFNSLSEDQRSADYWNRDEAKPVRKEIKDHYIAEQRQKCCYCNLHIPTNHTLVWDAEHVISRTRAPRFLFEPRNLAIACKDCNGAKSDEEVRENSKRVSFPDQSTDYKIIHPHFDLYDEHLRWFGSVCKPLTEKGKYTIVVCNLLRFSLNCLGDSAIPRNPVFDRLLGTLLEAKDRNEAFMALAGVKDYLDRIPQN